MVGSNGEALWDQIFLALVYEVEHETFCLSVAASRDKIGPEDHKGCVLNI
jgi:hypothetical protein